jgi:hypothetical protein
MNETCAVSGAPSRQTTKVSGVSSTASDRLCLSHLSRRTILHSSQRCGVMRDSRLSSPSIYPFCYCYCYLLATFVFVRSFSE